MRDPKSGADLNNQGTWVGNTTEGCGKPERSGVNLWRCKGMRKLLLSLTIQPSGQHDSLPSRARVGCYKKQGDLPQRVVHTTELSDS